MQVNMRNSQLEDVQLPERDILWFHNSPEKAHAYSLTFLDNNSKV